MMDSMRDPGSNTVLPVHAGEGSDVRRSHAQSRVTAALVGIGAFVAVAYPPLVGLYEYGFPIIFSFFAGDAFYYLAVAENSLGEAFYTFDGALPTNGFHPLWQYYLHTAFGLMGWGGEQASQLLFTFFSSIAFVGTGAALFALAVLRLTGRPLLSLLGVVPGATYLLVALIDPRYGAPWSFVNGMESPLTVLLGGGLVYLLIRREGDLTTAWTSLAALLAALLTLSRLDDVFLFVPLLLGILRYAPEGGRARGIALATAIPAVMIGGYLLYNLTTVGVLLPLSGLAKAQTSYGGFAFAENLIEGMRLFMPATEDFWKGAAWRAFLMLFPMLVAAAWLLYRGAVRPRKRPAQLSGEAVLSMMAWYVVLKGMYNLVNVRLWDQGHWYYPLSVFTANVIIAVWVHRALGGVVPPLRRRIELDLGSLIPISEKRVGVLLRGVLIAVGAGCIALGGAYLLQESADPALFGRYSWRRFVVSVGLVGIGLGVGWAALRGWSVGRLLERRFSVPIAPRRLAAVPALLALAFVATVFVNHKQGGADGVRSTYAFWRDRDAIAARLEGAGGVVEYDDGLLSYALPNGAMSGFGLALDPEAFGAWNRADLLSMAYARGYRLIGTGWYQRRWPEDAFGDPAALEAALQPLVGRDAVEAWDFRPFYVERSGEHSFAFIEFSPAPAP